MKLSDFHSDDIKVESDNKKKSEKSLKLSDFHPNDVETVEPQDNTAPMAESFATGALQGSTAGFAPALSGIGKTAMDAITGVSGPLAGGSMSDLVDEYRKTRDDTKKDFNKSASDNPYSHMFGNLVGGLPLVNTLGAVGTEASQATKAGRVLDAAETGAGYGGLTGLGNSDADLTKGELGKALDDTLVGTATGGVLGGALQEGAEGLKSAGNAVLGAIGKTKVGKDLAYSFKRGRAGEDLSSLPEQQQKVLDLSKRVVTEDIPKLQEQVKAAYSDIQNAAKDSSDTVSISDLVDKYQPLIENLSAQPETKKDADQLLSLLKDYSEGEAKTVTANAKVIKPGKITQVDEKPSTQQVLEQKAAIAKEQAKVLGQNLKTDIIPGEDEEGNKLLTLLKTMDENNQGNERVITDKETGDVLGMTPAAEGNNSTTASATTLLDTPGQDAQTLYSRGDVVPKTFKGDIRTGGSTDLSKSDLFDLQKEIGDLRFSLSKNQNADPQVLDLAKNLDNEATKLATGNIEGLGDANKLYRALDLLKRKMGLKTANAVVKDPGTGESLVKDTVLGKLNNRIRQAGGDTTPAAGANESLDQFQKLMSVINPEKADALRQEFSTAGKDLDISRKINSEGLLNKSGGIVERVAKSIFNPLKLANKAGGFSTRLYSATPEQLTQAAQYLSTTGEIGKKLSSVFTEAATKDQIGRNAMLFTIQQNPSYREFLEHHFGEGQ